MSIFKDSYFPPKSYKDDWRVPLTPTVGQMITNAEKKTILPFGFIKETVAIASLPPIEEIKKEISRVFCVPAQKLGNGKRTSATEILHKKG